MSTTVIVSENGQGRYQQEIVVGGKHRLIADEPTAVGGDDAGPPPLDFILAGLGACTAMTVRMYAERKQMPLVKVSVALSLDKVDIDGKHVDRIERVITVEGELAPEQRERLLDIANKCPVHRFLQHPVQIESRLD